MNPDLFRGVGATGTFENPEWLKDWIRRRLAPADNTRIGTPNTNIGDDPLLPFVPFIGPAYEFVRGVETGDRERAGEAVVIGALEFLGPIAKLRWAKRAAEAAKAAERARKIEAARHLSPPPGVNMAEVFREAAAARRASEARELADLQRRVAEFQRMADELRDMITDTDRLIQAEARRRRP